ncbi:hypothetical protein [Gluconobacter oxydans]|uniref:Uncharacterized protein n=1 Tax=Gluconobacter oxydans NBRC 3293 TaxID=1315969 RepID=A0A829WXW0_GLUOY|nr:hypothetical protein [Gluconobacter oxydans]GEM15772.1 hypothetical protein NBRC3293_0269 [Gluconobacter oxydans NBRC 3293]
MIIGATRIRVASKSGPHALIKHIFAGKDNEAIAVLQGGRHMVQAAHEDAKAAGRTYSNRHFSVSPEEATTRDQAQQVFRSIADEFGFDLADATVVEHHKARQDGQGYERHWHVIVPELRPDGTALDSKFMRARQEKLGRLAEIRLGHPITHGKHDKAVLKALERDSLPEAQAFADILRWREFGPGAGEPKSAYSSETHQILKRHGLSTPAIKAAISAAWATRSEEIGLSFRGVLHHVGIDLVPGKRPGAWVAVVDGVEVTALHRLLKVKSSEVESEMAAQRKAPAWTRASGGYDELSTQNQKRAVASFQAFQVIYRARHGADYPYDLENYVTWVQEQEAQRQQAIPGTRATPAPRRPRAPNDGQPAPPQETPTSAAQAPARPKSLPLPDDKDALKRVIGESPWSDANRDPARIADEYRRRVQSVREKAEKRLETAEKAIERTAPQDEIAEGKAVEKWADIAAGLALKLINTVLKVFGIPEIPHPNFGGPRVVGQLPGNPKEHETAHREAEKLREYIANLPDDNAITQKGEQVALARQAEHDGWLDQTAPARLKLTEIEAREKAEREEAERRARVEEARQAAQVAARERVEIDAPELGPEVHLDEEIERLRF